MMKKPTYKCQKCGWTGKNPGSMGAAGFKIKICQNCLSSKLTTLED